MCNKLLLLQLKNPFQPSEVNWRVGNKAKGGKKATAFPYIKAREVMKRLDEVLGIENWQDEYVTEPPRKVRLEVKQTWEERKNNKPKEYYYEEISGRVICKLSLRIGGEWITKCDGAAATNVAGDKGAITDAFKRAAIKFGIGRYLDYIDTSFYHPIDDYGNFTSLPQLPAWALPQTIEQMKGSINAEQKTEPS